MSSAGEFKETSAASVRGGRSSAAALPLPSFASVEELAKAMQGQMAAAIAIPRALAEAQLTIGAELFGFLGRRLKAQAELCHELSLCRELSDAVQAQRRFNERVASDYSAEMDQMTTMLSRETGVVVAAASGAVETASKGVKIAA